eukprot:jgi/Chlat1/4431/Chrsp29S00326
MGSGMESAATTDRTFEELQPPLSEEMLAALRQQGFTHLTPVQAATIPLFMSNKDVAVDAVTGSGKTLAFIVPVVELLSRREHALRKYQVGAMIISPTRELALQIFAVLQLFLTERPNLRAMLLVGGTEVAADVARFQSNGANILVGTPGRLDDVLTRSAAMDVKELDVLVLDEADRLLDMGFRQQLSSILARLPKQRRTGLFSATQTSAVVELARAGMRNPVRVEVKQQGKSQLSGKQSTTASQTPSTLSLHFVRCEVDRKMSQLVQFLTFHSSAKCIVYFLTCASVDYWAMVLQQLRELKSLKMQALHGKMKQACELTATSQREKALAEYTEWPAGVLLCTDVAARGLDIPGVDWIIQFDPPQDPDAFIHRVGRTARMGRSGSALVYLLPKEDAYVEFLRLRGVGLAEMAPDDNAPEVLSQIRTITAADRAVMEKGLRAFVSFVRGYKEHVCKYIFRFKDLNFGALAMLFGLLRLPTMSELKRGRVDTSAFIPFDIDLATIKYKDKLREKQRQQNLKKAQASVAASDARVNSGAGATTSGKGFNSKGNSKNQQHKGSVQPARMELPKGSSKKKRQQNDEEQMEREYKLLKKMKKGKLSEAEYELETGDGEEKMGVEHDEMDRADSAGALAPKPLQQKGMGKKKRQQVQRHVKPFRKQTR